MQGDGQGRPPVLYADMSRYFGLARAMLKGMERICGLAPEFLAMADQKKL